MIHADQRRSLRQPITLDRRVPQTPPEFFSLRIERRASGNKRPELPSELSMDRAKNPPSPQKVLPIRHPEPPPKIFDLFVVLQIALNLLFQLLQNSRHTLHHRHVFTPYRAHD